MLLYIYYDKTTVEVSYIQINLRRPSISPSNFPTNRALPGCVLIALLKLILFLESGYTLYV